MHKERPNALKTEKPHSKRFSVCQFVDLTYPDPLCADLTFLVRQNDGNKVVMVMTLFKKVLKINQIVKIAADSYCA
jgi:hypothetical protein